MNQKVSDSCVGPHGCGDAMLLYTLATASETRSTYGITTDVLWSTDLGLGFFFLEDFLSIINRFWNNNNDDVTCIAQIRQSRKCAATCQRQTFLFDAA